MTSTTRDPGPILLTGASGYVGFHLLDELRARGRRVDPPGEVQVGGAEVLTDREMMRLTAWLPGRP
jgi:nucleoside-diphosphate-sugar epimerase